MRKNCTLLQTTLLAFLLFLGFETAKAETFEVDGIYYSILSDESEGTIGTVEVVIRGGGEGYAGDIILPETVNIAGKSYAVTSIAGSAFSRCNELTSVVIPNSITTIGSYCFEESPKLTTIIIPNSVTTIKRRAFNNSVGLTSITIPSSVTSIGDFLFYGCNALTSIVVEEGNTVYDSRENCNAIIETETGQLIAGCQSTVIPNSVTGIGMGAFSKQQGITNVTIPNSVMSIGQSAFSQCSNLTSVSIPNSVTTIERCAFELCGFSNITIPNSVTKFGHRAFGECSNLKTLYCYANWFLPGVSLFPNTPVEKATLYVPYHQIELYKADREWGKFGTILPITHKVTYMVDGEEYATDSVGYGAPITPMENPTKEGYTFSGWNEIPGIMPEHDVVVTGSFKSSGIEEVTTDTRVDVYNLQGIKVQEQVLVTDLEKILPQGVYIVKGKKLVVK